VGTEQLDPERTSTKADFMLGSIKQLYGRKLHASVGEIGHVKDFYFGDQKWVVRYVVADTGPWLLGRLVLIAPHAFSGLDQAAAFLLVNLTRQQIGESVSESTVAPNVIVIGSRRENRLNRRARPL
jgi:hypothetical protein